MGRRSVESGGPELDVIDQTCLALQLSDEQCEIVREAAREYCRTGGAKGRRPSEYNLYIGRCVREKAGPVTERFRQCVEAWKASHPAGAG